MNQKLIFVLKVWLTSVFLGPLLLLFNASNQNAIMFNPDFTKIIDYAFSSDFAVYYLVAIIIGGICSIPCFLFLWLCFFLLGKTNLSVWKIRTLLVGVSLLCCTVIFMLFSLSDLDNFWKKGNIVMVGAYALPLIFGVLFYRIKARKFAAQPEDEKEPVVI